MLNSTVKESSRATAEDLKDMKTKKYKKRRRDKEMNEERLITKMWSGAQLEGSTHCERRIGNRLLHADRSGSGRAHCTKIQRHTTCLPKVAQSDTGPSANPHPPVARN